jgi:YfiH family protein
VWLINPPKRGSRVDKDVMHLIRRTTENGVVVYVSPQLEQIGVHHGFSTRIGGTSPAPFDSLNLGNPNGVELQDDRSRIAGNYDRLLVAVGLAGRPRYFVHQVHGAEVAVVRSSMFSVDQKADALATELPGTVVSVRVADCCPVLLSSKDGRAVAAIHAGWRGTVGGVIPATIKVLCELSGAKPTDLLAAVGPCIGMDAFEVGPEVLAEFAREFGGDALIRRRPDGKGHADVPGGCRTQLIRAGVPADRIDTTDRCTFRDAGEFFSHRRDRGVTGRMAAVIAPVAPYDV